MILLLLVLVSLGTSSAQSSAAPRAPKLGNGRKALPFNVDRQQLPDIAVAREGDASNETEAGFRHDVGNLKLRLRLKPFGSKTRNGNDPSTGVLSGSKPSDGNPSTDTSTPTIISFRRRPTTLPSGRAGPRATADDDDNQTSSREEVAVSSDINKPRQSVSIRRGRPRKFPGFVKKLKKEQVVGRGPFFGKIHANVPPTSAVPIVPVMPEETEPTEGSTESSTTKDLSFLSPTRLPETAPTTSSPISDVNPSIPAAKEVANAVEAASFSIVTDAPLTQAVPTNIMPRVSSHPTANRGQRKDRVVTRKNVRHSAVGRQLHFGDLRPSPTNRNFADRLLSKEDPQRRGSTGQNRVSETSETLEMEREPRKPFGTAPSRRTSRYFEKNPDGSITWGYKSPDGSFKEETIGVNCVTRGSYGYVDPKGHARVYSYESGTPCDPQTKQPLERISGPLAPETGNQRGYFDYGDNKYVMPDGRRVRIKVNSSKRRRGG